MKTLFNKFIKWLSKPMTPEEEKRSMDFQRAISGSKRCPHCKQYI